MKPRSEYLATRVFDGKFLALSQKGKLYVWDLLTGKPLQNKFFSDKTFIEQEVYRWGDEEEVYGKEWYGKILLKKKEPIEDFD